MTKEGIIDPYQNESESLQLDELTIENRLDRVSIYGSIDLTLDKRGLAKAQQLKQILELVCGKLTDSVLPDQITIVEPETAENPFLCEPQNR